MNTLLSLSLVAAASAWSKYENVAAGPIQAPHLCPLDKDSPFSDSCDLSFGQNVTLQAAKSALKPQKHAVPDDFPWTFWPECFANENVTEPFCVFSSQNFAQGRGVGIVSTSKAAYGMLQDPAFADPAVLSLVNQYDNPSFEERDFPGKGRGLVANKTINRGDQIFASTPLLIMNPDAYELVPEERLKLAHRAVEWLPEKTKPLFWALLDHFKGDPVDDRINTNAFDVTINGIAHHVVFPEIARLNHDCRPNAAYFFDPLTLTHYVHATNEILPGQEITITYINNEQHREKRQEILHYNWGFHCTCSACMQNPALTEESDSRLDQIATLEEKLDDWSADSEASIGMAETLIELMKQERLFGSLGGAYKLAAMAYSSYADKWNAIRYARLSIEYSILDKGFRDNDVFAMKQLATDPEMQWSWRKRVGLNKKAGCGCGGHH